MWAACIGQLWAWGGWGSARRASTAMVASMKPPRCPDVKAPNAFGGQAGSCEETSPLARIFLKQPKPGGAHGGTDGGAAGLRGAVRRVPGSLPVHVVVLPGPGRRARRGRAHPAA